MPISLNGLASGLDTESIISQLMAIEQNKVTAVQRRQIAVQQHKTDLTTIKTKLDAVKTAAADLASATTVEARADDELVGPDQGRRQDARRRRHRRPFARGPQDGLLGPARLLVHPERGRGLAHALLRLRSERGRQLASSPITVAANATATDVATLINANEGSPVYAAVVKDGADERLVFSARKTGENSNFTVDTSALAGGQMTEVPAYARTGTALNASYTLDGEASPRSSESNVIENAIPGVRLTLKGITSSPVSVNTAAPAVDTEAIAKKITALVDAYNAVVTSTRSEMTEKKIPTAYHQRGPPEGPAVRRHRHDLDAAQPQGDDDADPQRPRAHRPGRPSASASPSPPAAPPARTPRTAS